jgi:hypothetical protein
MQVTAARAEAAAPPAPPAETNAWQWGGAFGLSAIAAVPYGPSGAGEQLELGFNADFRVGYGPVPLTLGLELGGLFGSQERQRATFDDADAFGGEIDTTLKRDRQMMLIDLVLRVQPRQFFLRPYAEGVVGLQITTNHYTAQLTHSEQVWDEDGVASTSIGWGLGLDIAFDDTLGLWLGFRRIYGPTLLRSYATLDQLQTPVVRYTQAANVTMFMVGITSMYKGF